jgi:hypothetical protein
LQCWQRCGLLVLPGYLSSICHFCILRLLFLLLLLLLHGRPPLQLQLFLLEQQLRIYTAPEARHAAHRACLGSVFKRRSSCLHAAHGSGRRQGAGVQQRLTSQQGLQRKGDLEVAGMVHGVG